jgi:hypothetical protein
LWFCCSWQNSGWFPIKTSEWRWQCKSDDCVLHYSTLWLRGCSAECMVSWTYNRVSDCFPRRTTKSWQLIAMFQIPTTLPHDENICGQMRQIPIHLLGCGSMKGRPCTQQHWVPRNSQR